MGVLLALLVGASGCAGPRLSRCAAEGGATWRELTSEHFRLKTDLPLEEARAGLAQLETTRAALGAAAFPGVAMQGTAKLTVYLLADDADFRSLYPPLVDGFFVAHSGGKVAVVLHGSPKAWAHRALGHGNGATVLAHELTHHLSVHAFPHQPLWFSEGLALLMETLRVSDDGRTVFLGEPHVSDVQRVRALLTASLHHPDTAEHLFTVSRIFDWERDRAELEDWETVAMYSTSWLLVHWLFNLYPAALAQFQALLAEGKSGHEAMASALGWVRALPIDELLLDYAWRRQYTMFTVPMTQARFSVAERNLPDAEVHATRAFLAAIGAGKNPKRSEELKRLVAQEVAEALRLDPWNVGALQLWNPGASEAEQSRWVHAAVKKHPEDPEAWRLLAVTLQRSKARPAEIEHAYRQAVALDPDDAGAANELAWMYLLQRRFDEALPLAERAVRRAPWDDDFIDTYAFVLAGVGRCAEAVAAEERALVQASSQHRSVAKVTRYRKKVAQLQGDCQASPED
jgi:tetratricopeptide (TPR) repeat protein